MSKITHLTSMIAVSYVAGNAVPVNRVGDLIAELGRSLHGLSGEVASPSKVRRPTEAQVAASITPDGIRSFENHKFYKMLRHHLAGMGMSPAEYRQKWGLPVDYPMVAPEYSVRRTAISRQTAAAQRLAAKA